MRHPAIAVDVAREYLPVIDAGLPRLAGVAQHQPPFEFGGVADQRLAPLAAGQQFDGADAAKRRRIMVLGSRRHANDNGFNVAADVDPVLAMQARTGDPVERRADGHSHAPTSRQSPRLLGLPNRWSACSPMEGRKKRTNSASSGS